MLYEKEALSIYFDEMNKIELHTHEDSIELFKKLEKGDKRARDLIIKANLRLVVSVAKKFKVSSIPLEDLIQEGNIGLMKAIEKYDWKTGYRFSTYATWWIRQSIGQHIMRSKCSIRLPAHAVGLQKKMAAATEKFKEEFNSEPSVEELSKIMNGASERIVRATMLSGHKTVSLQSPLIMKEGYDDESTIEDTVQDNSPGPFEKLSHVELVELVKDQMKNLTPKELIIMRLRYGLAENPNDPAWFVSSDDETIKQEEHQNDNK
jgi:RNA polymerase primary sigma factor